MTRINPLELQTLTFLKQRFREKVQLIRDRVDIQY